MIAINFSKTAVNLIEQKVNFFIFILPKMVVLLMINAPRLVEREKPRF